MVNIGAESHVPHEKAMSNGNEDPKPGVALSDGPVRNPDVVKTRKAQEDHKYRQRWLLHTLSRKNLMALTGFFLCLFLVIHLFGNLQLLLPAEVARWQFNFYSKLLSENLFIVLISYVLFASILAHAIYALLITIQNDGRTGNVMSTTAGRQQQMVFSQDGVTRHYHSVFSHYPLTGLLVSTTVWSRPFGQRRTERPVYSGRYVYTKTDGMC